MLLNAHNRNKEHEKASTASLSLTVVSGLNGTFIGTIAKMPHVKYISEKSV